MKVGKVILASAVALGVSSLDLKQSIFKTSFQVTEAEATTCRFYGNRMRCSDGYSATTYGNRSYGSDGVTTRSYGNRTYGSDGYSTRSYGNRTYGSDGTTCRTYGNRIRCN